MNSEIQISLKILKIAFWKYNWHIIDCMYSNELLKFWHLYTPMKLSPRQDGEHIPQNVLIPKITLLLSISAPFLLFIGNHWFAFSHEILAIFLKYYMNGII